MSKTKDKQIDEINKKDERKEAVGLFKSRMEDLNDPERADILEVSDTLEKKLLLSWGGPSDGFKAYFKQFDGQWEFDHMVHFYANWGTYLELDMSEEEANKVLEAYPELYVA